jgi:hypothetical protein
MYVGHDAADCVWLTGQKVKEASIAHCSLIGINPFRATEVQVGCFFRCHVLGYARLSC